MNSLTPSRRNVMRALAALSTGLPTLAYAAPGLVCLPVTDPAWEAALATEQRTREASERFYAAHVKTVGDAHDAGTVSFDVVSAQEDAWAPYNIEHADAVDDLILTPAPSLDAVVHKLKLGIETAIFDGSTRSFKLIAVIADDIERLGGRA